MNLAGRCIVTAISPLLAMAAVGCQSVDSPARSSTMRAISPTNLKQSILHTVNGRPPDREIALASFTQAEKTFDAASTGEQETRDTQFKAAVAMYETAAKNAPNTTIEEDALMMAAESLFFADEYTKATLAYDQLIKKYPRTRHLDQIDQRRFAISQYWLALNKKQTDVTRWLPNLTDKQRPATDSFGSATRTLDKIRFDNPTGKLADDATMAAAIAKFEKGNYADADILFADIRENFPASEHQFQAHLLGLKCKRETYRGPDYAGTVLDEAATLIKQMYQRFPEKAAEHDEHLKTAYKNIRLKQASRDFAIAQYYDQRKEYAAARMYYHNVREKFSDTNLALESEDRLSSIADLPDVPAQRLQWLTKVFPEDKGVAKPIFNRSTTGVAK